MGGNPKIETNWIAKLRVCHYYTGIEMLDANNIFTEKSFNNTTP